MPEARRNGWKGWIEQPGSPEFKELWDRVECTRTFHPGLPGQGHGFHAAFGGRYFEFFGGKPPLYQREHILVVVHDENFDRHI